MSKKIINSVQDIFRDMAEISDMAKALQQEVYLWASENMPAKTTFAATCGEFRVSADLSKNDVSLVYPHNLGMLKASVDQSAKPTSNEDILLPQASWLYRALSDGPVFTADLRIKAMHDGFSWEDVKAVRAAIGAVSNRIDRNGRYIGWQWSLPGKSDLSSKACLKMAKDMVKARQVLKMKSVNPQRSITSIADTTGLAPEKIKRILEADKQRHLS